MPTKVAMKPLGIVKHVFCFITLGLLCGWYFFLIIFIPALLYASFHGYIIAQFTLLLLIILTVTPLKHDPWLPFMNSWIFDWWCDYFDLTFDNSSISGENKLIPSQRYILYEFPHGIFPIGQFLSAHYIDKITPGDMICGTGADVVFKFPVMRQIMAWLGTQPARRENITKIFKKGQRVAIIPGGIAEMFLVNEESEKIYFKSRQGAVKAAIQEGAHIIPVFFFGNTKVFKVVGQNGTDSFLAKLSRRLRASVVLFYGRYGLPVPFRHPIHFVTGDMVKVVQNDNPTEVEINEVQAKVIISIEKLYKEKRPEWETRPLIIL